MWWHTCLTSHGQHHCWVCLKVHLVSPPWKRVHYLWTRFHNPASQSVFNTKVTISWWTIINDKKNIGYGKLLGINLVVAVRKALQFSVRTQVVSLFSLLPHFSLWYRVRACLCFLRQEWRYVWCTSWNMSSRGMAVSAPCILEARRSNAETICFTTSSKNTWASWEWRRERNSKEIAKSTVQVRG